MKNIIICLLIFISFTICKVYAQCNTSNLFPVKHGINKFQALNTLNLINNITEIKTTEGYIDPSEKNPINYSYITFKNRINNCIYSKDYKFKLAFSDDKLYSIDLEIFFKTDEYNNCLKNYNLILNSLKKEFTFYDESEIYNSEDKKEQTGTGWFLYKTKEKMEVEKPKFINIVYKIVYEELENESSSQYKKAKYVLEITFYDFKYTKKDIRE